MMMKYEKEIFGDMKDYQLWTDVEPEEIKEGSTVYLVNSNCEFSYDNIKGSFEENLLYCIICDLDFQESDLSEWDISKSNTGGAYAYATATIKQIKKITY